MTHGGEIYGAHYRVRMETDARNHWSICLSEYNPGRLAVSDVSGTDISLSRDR